MLLELDAPQMTSLIETTFNRAQEAFDSVKPFGLPIVLVGDPSQLTAEPNKIYFPIHHLTGIIDNHHIPYFIIRNFIAVFGNHFYDWIKDSYRIASQALFGFDKSDGLTLNQFLSFARSSPDLMFGMCSNLRPSPSLIDDFVDDQKAERSSTQFLHYFGRSDEINATTFPIVRYLLAQMMLPNILPGIQWDNTYYPIGVRQVTRKITDAQNKYQTQGLSVQDLAEVESCRLVVEMLVYSVATDTFNTLLTQRWVLGPGDYSIHGGNVRNALTHSL